MNSYVEEVFELKHVCTSIKVLCTVLDARYENQYLNKIMKNQCHNLT